MLLPLSFSPTLSHLLSSARPSIHVSSVIMQKGVGPPMGFRRAWLIKLPQVLASPLVLGWARQSSRRNRFSKASQSPENRPCPHFQESHIQTKLYNCYIYAESLTWSHIDLLVVGSDSVNHALMSHASGFCVFSCDSLSAAQCLTLGLWIYLHQVHLKQD